MEIDFSSAIGIEAQTRSKIANVLSISGGKDSTAQLLLALESGVQNIIPVFADTGHEHEHTYAYLDYLEQALGLKIIRLKADFSEAIEKKRKFIANDTRIGRKGGRRIRWTNKRKRMALEILHPTGIPFLDLCLLKGRFPSTRARFCSEELKHKPIDDFIASLVGSYDAIISWQGVRADESPARKNLPKYEVELGAWLPEPKGLLIYRPIIDWTAQDAFDQHRKSGVKWNPLYEQGQGRVGCMPCIHAKKDELRQISNRFPQEIDRVERWEALVGTASKRGVSTFFSADKTPGPHQKDRNLPMPGIREVVEWSKTSRGGRNYDLIHAVEIDTAPYCQSSYGLCE